MRSFEEVSVVSLQSTSEQPFRVIVVDDLPLVAEGIARLLDGLPGFRVISVCTTAQDAREAIERTLPDLVITDIDMSGMEIFSFIRRTRRLAPRVAILVISALSAEVYAERVIRAGASGFLGKDANVQTLASAVRVIAQGGSWIPHGFATVGSKRNNPEPAKSLSNLSSRELEIFRHMGWGRTTREIAEVLHISPRTVATHRFRIYRKLGVFSTGGLMRLAQEHLMGGSAL
jgi:two-component system invasion response regulator UvrY